MAAEETGGLCPAMWYTTAALLERVLPSRYRLQHLTSEWKGRQILISFFEFRSTLSGYIKKNVLKKVKTIHITCVTDYLPNINNILELTY